MYTSALKLTDMKLTDHMTGHVAEYEVAEHENLFD